MSASVNSSAAHHDQNRGGQPPNELKFLEGGGVMGDLIRGFDWSKTILGSPGAWPESLKTSVSTCLNSRFAILIWWGNNLIKLYNDAYSLVLGKKHPHALGSAGQEVWPEIWHIIGPMLKGVLERGEATWADDLLLELARDGYAEECYFTFSYSPIRDESGKVVGVFTPVQETTGKVIGERRLRTLRDLADAARASNAQNTADVCRAAAQVLAQNPQDIPFAALYTFEHDQAVLSGSAGIDNPCRLFPDCIRGEAGAGGWTFARALESVVAEVLEIPQGLEGLPCGAWPLPPSEAIFLPISPAGQRTGFMIAGVSPRKRLDADYRSFMSLVVRQITTAIAEVNTLQQERRRAESLAEIDRAKTTFFSNVSHEFRTPLTLMLGPLEDTLALGSQLPDQVQRSLTVIQRNSLRLLRLVNSLLDFSRIEAGRMRAAYEPTDLSSFTAELASTFRSATDHAGLALIVECSPLPYPVYVDREMWEKIVLNLLSNAFKFTFNGHITVKLVEAAADHVELSIQDTGIGIAEDQLPHLFERFHRVEGARGRTIEGTGIGMALIQELVRLHEGSVHVASEVGRGSTFTVSIPFHPTHLTRKDTCEMPSPGLAAIRPAAFVDEALQWLPKHGEFAASVKRPEGQGENVPKFSGNSETVLVVDDNTDMREYLGRLLGEKFHVIAAANGEEALEAARTERVDLVLSDIIMPGLDGYGLISRLRSDPNTQTIPVILLSARAGEEARSEGMGTGADDYLVKPFAARELLARVEAHLSLARMRREADQARRLSELRLKLALEATGVLAWQWDSAKEEFSSSGDMVRIFGMKLESSIEAFQLVHPEDLAAHRAKAEPVAREGGSYYSEFRIHRADSGVTAWLEERATGITDDAGRVVCVVGIVADVTQRKQAEVLLRQQRHTFDTALSNTPDLMCNFDLDGRFTYANRALLDLWQIPLESVIGRKTFDLDYPADLAGRLQRQLQAAIDTGETVRDNITYSGAAGQKRTFDYIFAPVFSEEGRVEAVTCSARDITDHQRMEQELAASKERLNQVFEQAPVAIVAFRGQDFVVELANPFYRALLPGRDMIGRRFADVVPELQQEVWDVFHRVIETGQPYTANEWKIPYDSDQDGLIEDHWFNLVYHPLRETDGTISGFVAVLTDVTPQVQARREVERINKELEEFAYVASHDLQEPLRMVNIYTELLMRRYVPDQPEAKKLAGHVKQGAMRMEALIRDLLTYSRTVQREEKPLGFADLSAALAEAMTVLQRSIEENGATIHAPSLPFVRGDTKDLSHVFQNLISNALKYRKKDLAPDVNIAARRDAENWVISVRDNGIGFDQQYAEQIFGLFKRLHKNEYPGTGLGLAICQRTVERFGGRIWAESALGAGTTFFFTLAAVDKKRNRLRILLAEDNPGDVMLVREALQQHGVDHELHVAEDGEEALAYVARMGKSGEMLCPDLLLLDLNLPKCDGPTVLKALRGHAEGADIPVIVITSSDASKDQARIANLGIKHHFRKPSNYEEFMQLGSIVQNIIS